MTKKLTLLGIAVSVLAFIGCAGEDGGGAGGDGGDLRLPNISFSRGGMAVRGVYAAEPAVGDRAAMYFTITNETGSTDELLGVSSPLGRAEIHQSLEEDGRMTMARVEKITIPSGWTVHLEPGSYHVMLRGLERPLQAGDRVSATLEFQSGRTLEIAAVVRPYAELEELLGGAEGR